MTMYDLLGQIDTSADTEEKNTIGQLWASRSKGRLDAKRSNPINRLSNLLSRQTNFFLVIPSAQTEPD